MTRTRLCNLVPCCGGLLEPLYRLMVHRVKPSFVIHADHHKTPLEQALNCTRFTIDNNVAQWAVGRKNWLFIGGDAGLHTASMLLSLCASAKRHGVSLGSTSPMC